MPPALTKAEIEAWEASLTRKEKNYLKEVLFTTPARVVASLRRHMESTGTKQNGLAKRLDVSASALGNFLRRPTTQSWVYPRAYEFLEDLRLESGRAKTSARVRAEMNAVKRLRGGNFPLGLSDGNHSDNASNKSKANDTAKKTDSSPSPQDENRDEEGDVKGSCGGPVEDRPSYVDGPTMHVLCALWYLARGRPGKVAVTRADLESRLAAEVGRANAVHLAGKFTDRLCKRGAVEKLSATEFRFPPQRGNTDWWKRLTPSGKAPAADLNRLEDWHYGERKGKVTAFFREVMRHFERGCSVRWGASGKVSSCKWVVLDS